MADSRKETKRKLKDLDEESFEVIDVEKEEKNKKEIEIINSSSDSSNDNDIVEISNEATTSKKIKLTETSKSKCQYGSSCYRKNPQHFEEFDHLNEG
jgi:hypothetical protein